MLGNIASSIYNPFINLHLQTQSMATFTTNQQECQMCLEGEENLESEICPSLLPTSSIHLSCNDNLRGVYISQI